MSVSCASLPRSLSVRGIGFPSMICLLALACYGERASAVQRTALPVWTLEPDLRYDDSPAPLTEVGDVVVDASGLMFVAQSSERSVKVFGPDGRFERSIGRSGEGPGEFRNVRNLLALGGDSVWINDYSLRRATIMAGDGTAIRTISFRHPLGTHRYGSAYPFGDRYLILPAVSATEAGRNDSEYRQPLLMADAQGQLIEPLGFLAFRNAFAGIEYPGGTIWAIPPAAHQDKAAVESGGNAVVIAQADHPAGTAGRVITLTRVRAPGDTIFSVRIPVHGAALEPSRLRQLLDESAERYASRFPSQQAARRAVRTAWGDTPEQLSPVDALLVDAEARAWIRTTSLENVWLVVDPTGRPIATVRAPADVQLRAADARHAWGVRLDEFDVPSILRFRIRTTQE